MNKPERIKKEIRELVKEYYHEVFAPKPFEPGKSHVPVSGKVFDDKEIYNVVESALDGWFTTGRFNTHFEKRLTKYIGVKHALTVNSGSSANLLAVATLTAEELGEEAVKPGDEVITVAASFPTTINPWLLYGAVPVFVDVDIPTYNIDVSRIEAAITPKTKAIMVVHLYGRVCWSEKLNQIAQKYNLKII